MVCPSMISLFLHYTFSCFEGRNNERQKAIEERKRTMINIQRIQNDLKSLVECQALNKEDRSLTDGPCVS